MSSLRGLYYTLQMMLMIYDIFIIIINWCFQDTELNQYAEMKYISTSYWDQLEGLYISGTESSL